MVIEGSKVDGKEPFEVWLSDEGTVLYKLLYGINISLTGSPMQRRPTCMFIWCVYHLFQSLDVEIVLIFCI